MFCRSKQLPGQYPLPLKIDHPGFVLVTETLALADLEVCLAHIPYGPNSYIFAYIYYRTIPAFEVDAPQWVDAPWEILDLPLPGWSGGQVWPIQSMILHLVSMVKDTNEPTVWSNGPRNKYDPENSLSSGTPTEIAVHYTI